ncbi:hypothetical protein A2U01_0038568, partial [Trifolium medium]|nr:hypothetical protein [Trifolium medium]
MMDTDPKPPRRLIMGFGDHKFPLIVLATIANHDVSRMLIDEGSSHEIMYEELFLKLNLKEHLMQYTGEPLMTLDDSPTQPLGIVILSTTFQDGKTRASRRTIQVKFLVVSCTSVYNYILGRLTLASLGAVPSPENLKMKYHEHDNM